MKKLVIASGAIALFSGGMLLPSLAQHSGRVVTREVLTESEDFVRAGNHILNRAHIAYVTRDGNQSTVYFVGNVPPLYLRDNGDALVAQLAPGADPSLPQMPNDGRSPFELEAPEPARRPSRRVLPSPGSPRPSGPPLEQATPPPTLPSPGEPGLSIPNPGDVPVAAPPGPQLRPFD